MTDINPRDSKKWGNLEDDPLDRDLNTVLAKFAAAEPRAGLEQRVLTRLQVEQQREASGFLWRWPMVAALAALAVVFLVAMVLRPAKQAQEVAINRLAAIATIVSKPEGLAESHAADHSIPPRQELRRIKPHDTAQTGRAVPKLAQFPSPRPLSEQERLLVRFVQEFPEEAATIAKAQAESEKELERPSEGQLSGGNSVQQDQQER